MSSVFDSSARPSGPSKRAGVGDHGRDLASLLVRRVEQAARSSGFRELWLYTSKAEGLYAKLGWTTTERVERPGKPTVPVMRIDLTG